MYKRGNKEFILDMFLACQNILEYTEGLSLEDFVKDNKTVDAVIRNIEILGEAVKNISRDFRDRYRDIEWSEIARTGDKLIHFYFGIDREVVWDIVRGDIPKLFRKLKDIIEVEGWEAELQP